MELEQFRKVIQTEMAGVSEQLKTHVSSQVAEQLKTTGEAIAEIKKGLSDLQARGESPKAETVIEMEKRLAASETILREITLRLNGIQIASADKTEKDTGLFRGCFLTDQKKLRDALRSFHADDQATRAIDSSLFATGGKLSAETSDRFIDYVTEKQVALNRVTTRRMLGPEGKTDELTISSRKLRKAVEGLAPHVMNAIGTRRRNLQTVEVIWAEDITLTFLEDNIERAGAEAHIARLLGTQFGNDLNDLAWNGDQESASAPDPFTTINNGWLALAAADPDVNDVDAGSLATPSNTDILGAMYGAQAFDFIARTDGVYFMPVPFCSKYAEEMTIRETAFGDSVLVGGFPNLRYFGIPVVPEPHLYLNNADKGMLTAAPNLYHGIQRVVTVDSEWQPRKRVVEFTITARDDFEYAAGRGIVLVVNIPAANR